MWLLHCCHGYCIAAEAKFFVLYCASVGCVVGIGRDGATNAVISWYTFSEKKNKNVISHL